MNSSVDVPVLLSEDGTHLLFLRCLRSLLLFRRLSQLLAYNAVGRMILEV
jgi:hypothetical protein